MYANLAAMMSTENQELNICHGFIAIPLFIFNEKQAEMYIFLLKPTNFSQDMTCLSKR
jgi:hypothetical protein